jgi:histidinol phosphatase-like enzyme
MDPAIFLDRDNTLIVNDGDLGDLEDARLLAGDEPELEAPRESGYRLIVLENQASAATFWGEPALPDDDLDEGEAWEHA